MTSTRSWSGFAILHRLALYELAVLEHRTIASPSRFASFQRHSQLEVVVCQNRICNMSLVLFYLFAALLSLHEVSCSPFSNGQVQPGVYPAPALPSNFTKNPAYWRSPNASNAALPASRGRLDTSIRQSRKARSSSVSQRQSGTSWAGWPNVRYMFSL